MKIIELDGKEYNLPEGWFEISIDQYEKVVKLSRLIDEYKSEILFTLEIYSILTGAPLDDLKKMTRGSFEDLAAFTSWLNTQPEPTDKEFWIIEGVEWRPLDNLNKLEMGDQVSIELMIKESDEVDVLGNILPILIRRVKDVVKPNGEVKKVHLEWSADEYDEVKELFKKNIAITDVMKLKSFF